MVYRRRSTLLIALSIVLACHFIHVAAEKQQHGILSQLSPSDIEEKLQECSIVQSLNAQKRAAAPEVSGLSARLFNVFFPGSPAINSLLATAYISGPPNFLLALCPPNIDPSSLSVMVAFAFGGLMGDTLFHLLPEIFLGEDEATRLTFVMVEPNKNLLLGVAIMVGFVTFVILDKILRIATGGAGHDHQHDNGLVASRTDEKPAAMATGVSLDASKNKVIARKPVPAQNGAPTESQASATTPPASSSGITPQAYLPLLADFTHNITDGLALSSSFYSSATLGATTTLAVFFHEIPHEVGDFALLIQSGFSKKRAMGAQFVTAIGAFLGTLIGILVQEVGGGNRGVPAELAAATADAAGTTLFGTSLLWGDMLLPFTAGTFLYVGTVAVIPELLETGTDKRQEVKTFVMQLGAMAAGAAIMLGISWS